MRIRERMQPSPNRGVSESGLIVQEGSGSDKAVHGVETHMRKHDSAVLAQVRTCRAGRYLSSASSRCWWAASNRPSQYAMRPDIAARSTKVAILMSQGA